MSKKTNEQILSELKKELGRLGYDYIKDRELTTHPDDWYLRVVLAKNAREYVVWVYNASTEGLGGGDYYNDESAALKGFETKK